MITQPSTKQPSRLVKPDEVNALRSQLDPYVRALAQSITNAVPDNVRAAWGTFAQAWVAYCADPPSASRAPLQLDDGLKFARLVTPWRALLKSYIDASPNGIQLVRWWTWTDELRNFKNKLDGQVRALDQSVAACRKLSDEERTDWLGVAAAWREFANKPLGTWDNTAEIEGGFALEAKITDWQRKIGEVGCADTGPPLRPSETSPEADRQKRKEESDEADKASKRPVPWAAPVVTIAVVVGLVAVLGFATKYMPSSPQPFQGDRFSLAAASKRAVET